MLVSLICGFVPRVVLLRRLGRYSADHGKQGILWLEDSFALLIHGVDEWVGMEFYKSSAWGWVLKAKNEVIDNVAG